MLRRDHRRRGARLAGGTAAVLVAAATALVFLPDRLGWDRHVLFALVTAYRPALLGIAAAGLVATVAVLLVRRRASPATLVALGVVAVVVVVSGAPVVARGLADPDPAPGGTELTLLTLNVFEGRADPDVLARIVTRAQPDLVVLPEAGERYRALIAARLPSYRSWTNVPARAADVRGIVVLASPRAGDVRVERLDTGTRYPWTGVSGGLLGPTRLIGVHLVAPVPEWIGYWPGELESLQRWCGSDAPALVVGDLNATPDHSAFRSGTAGCTDAASARGTGPVATWHAGAPRWLGAQIDHVLAVGGPSARSLEILDVPGTDHRGLLAVLRL